MMATVVVKKRILEEEEILEVGMIEHEVKDEA